MSKDMQAFWDKQASGYRIGFEKLEELASYRHRSECRHLFQVVHVNPNNTVLDHGCGTGRWTFEFAKRCKRVVAADHSPMMIQCARDEATAQNIKNIDFHVASVQEFQSQERFDIIVISAVLQYLRDEELVNVLKNTRQHLKPGGIIISRDTVAVKTRHELQNEFHEKIDDTYSVVYRQPEEYYQVYAQAGMKLHYSDDCTPTIFPMILYRRLLPKKHRQNRAARRLLKAALSVQYALDPFLLRHKWTYRPIMDRYWKIKMMYSIYRINDQAQGEIS